MNLERFGAALRHAGVGITVTSLTDVIAFAVGASTVIVHYFWNLNLYFWASLESLIWAFKATS